MEFLVFRVLQEIKLTNCDVSLDVMEFCREHFRIFIALLEAEILLAGEAVTTNVRLNAHPFLP